MTTHRVISFVAFLAISAALKPWTLDVRCRILITSAKTDCSSLKYYYNLGTQHCATTCFQRAPFRSASKCEKICRSRQKPLVKPPVPGSSINLNSSRPQPSKPSAAQAPLVTDPSWRAGNTAVPTSPTLPQHQNIEVHGENHQFGVQKQWTPNRTNDAMAPMDPWHEWDREAYSDSLRHVSSQQHNTPINPFNQQQWSPSNRKIALSRSFPQQTLPLILQHWNDKRIPQSNQDIAHHPQIENDVTINHKFARMPWTSRGIDNSIMSAVPQHWNDEIEPHEHNSLQNSRPDDEMERYNLRRVNEHVWALMAPTPVKHPVPAQWTGSIEESFPEYTYPQNLEYRSPSTAAQVFPQVSQPQPPRFLTLAGYVKPAIQLGMQENSHHGSHSNVAIGARSPPWLSESV